MPQVATVEVQMMSGWRWVELEGLEEVAPEQPFEQVALVQLPEKGATLVDVELPVVEGEEIRYLLRRRIQTENLELRQVSVEEAELLKFEVWEVMEVVELLQVVVVLERHFLLLWVASDVD